MSGGPRNDVAVYAPFASVLYAEDPDAATGGAETQMRFLVGALAERGFRVAHIVFEHPGMRAPDGVELVQQPAAAYERTWPLYVPHLLAALRRANASVYVARSASFEVGPIALFARASRRRFVLSTSSAVDVTKRPPLPSRSTIESYRVGRAAAHELIVQTEDQRELAMRELGREARLIRSFCAPVEPDPSATRREAFLWIGGLIDYKDPLAYVELARALPDAAFDMVVHRRGSAWEPLADQVYSRAAATANLTMLEHMPRERLLSLYPRAVAVVNTSTVEGFPNTFMEAWARGTPVLTLNVDPDGIVERHGLGFAANGSPEALVESARRLWEARDASGDVAALARGYIRHAHDPGTIGDQWADALRGYARRPWAEPHAPSPYRHAPLPGGTDGPASSG